MPDPRLMIGACVVAGAVAAVLILIGSWPWRAPRPIRSRIAAVLGVGAGWFVGCWRLGLHPDWPPREDLDRLLVVLLPVVLCVELAAARFPQRKWIVWLLRGIVAATTTPILLHGSIYLEELAGPGSRAWTTQQTWLILGGIAAALLLVWDTLQRLAQRSPGRWAPLALAVACGGAAITIMLSGYASGGQPGLPLAAVLIAVVVASLFVTGPVDAAGPISIGVVGLFSLLVVGRFFGELTTPHALLLGCAPLFCWVPDLPGLRRLGAHLRGGLRVVLTALPVAAAVFLARQSFVQDSAPVGTGDGGATIEDYMNYGQ
jgi:hypothetical protein